MSTIKAMPNDTEVERAILGMMLVWPDKIPIVRQEIGPRHFCSLPCRATFQAILDVHDETESGGLILVKTLMKKQGKLENIGGVRGLQELMDAYTIPQNLEYYCALLHDKLCERELTKAANETLRDVEDGGDAAELLSRARERLDRIGAEQSSDFTAAKDAFVETLQRMEERRQNPERSIRFGVREIDDLCDVEKGDLLTVAGESGAAKTSLLYQMIWHACTEQGHRALLFSAEIQRHKAMRRMACQAAGVNTRHAKSGRLTEEEVANLKMKQDAICQLNLKINDKTANLDKIISAALAEAQSGDVDIIAIDHAQEMQVTRRNGNDDRKAVAVAAGAKRIARATGALVVLLSQITELADGGYRLRGGDELRHEADTVLILRYPPEVTFGKVADGAHTTRRVVLAKARDAAQSEVTVPFYGPFLRFGEK